MKNFSLILISIIVGSGSVIAFDCTLFKRQDTCPHSACNFSTDNGTIECFSRCNNLDSKSCDENQNNCTSNPATCKVKASLDCTKSIADEATCKNVSTACDWVPGTTAKCEKKADTDKTCQDYTTSDTCDEDQNCDSHIESASYYFNGLCPGFKTTANCSTNYCNQAFKSCSPKGDCPNLKDVACSADQGCSWDADKQECSDACAQNDSITDCQTASATCNLTITCSDNPEAGTKSCNSDSFDSKFCRSVAIFTCVTKTNLCNDLTTCQNFSGCTYTPGIPNKCNNPTKCASIDPNNCDNYCEATLFSCTPTNVNTCTKALKNSDQCKQAGFCYFIQYGTCATKDTNAAFLTFSALITLSVLLF